MTEKDASTKAAEQSGLLDCSICIGLIVQPISLGCGHSFCRTCLKRALSRTRKKCPVCRAVCHASIADQPENVMLASIARACDPEQYAAKEAAAEEEKREWDSLLPIFYYNVPLFPGSNLSLHLFEPRYKLMMQRIINHSRRFAYVPNYSDYRASDGDPALIAEVRECEFLSDGRVLLEAKLVKRFSVKDPFVEDGTHGLHYCSQMVLEDDRAAGDEEEKFISLLTTEIRDRLTRLTVPHGEDVPTSPELLSLWITGLLPFDSRDKHTLLSSTSTSHRLRICRDKLNEMLNITSQATLGSLLGAAGEGGGGVPVPGVPATT